jgi:hypothetical protein
MYVVLKNINYEYQSSVPTGGLHWAWTPASLMLLLQEVVHKETEKENKITNKQQVFRFQLHIKHNSLSLAALGRLHLHFPSPVEVDTCSDSRGS